ncbi:MAG: hypothetical protein U1F43_18795 [Myxococcota bacterium]
MSPNISGFDGGDHANLGLLTLAAVGACGDDATPDATAALGLPPAFKMTRRHRQPLLRSLRRAARHARRGRPRHGRLDLRAPLDTDQDGHPDGLHSADGTWVIAPVTLEPEPTEDDLMLQ